MVVRPIPAISGVLSRRELADRLLRQDCLPLVMHGAASRWPAMQTWSLEFFGDKFADYPILAQAPQGHTEAQWEVVTKMSEYVAYLRSLNASTLVGRWVKGCAASLERSGLTLYAGNFNPCHPLNGDAEMVYRYVPRQPTFCDDWSCLLAPERRECYRAIQPHNFVYLSAPGAVTPLHADFWETHAFLAQISGHKRAVLISPKQTQQAAMVTVRECSEAQIYSANRHLEAFCGHLVAGDILIIPSGWLHYVETVSSSITYSANWISRSNWRKYVSFAEEALDSRLRRESGCVSR